MTGTVISWTVVHRPPEGFGAPLLIVLVRTDAGKMVLATASDNGLLQIGALVRVSEGTTGEPTVELAEADAG